MSSDQSTLGACIASAGAGVVLGAASLYAAFKVSDLQQTSPHLASQPASQLPWPHLPVGHSSSGKTPPPNLCGITPLTGALISWIAHAPSASTRASAPCRVTACACVLTHPRFYLPEPSTLRRMHDMQPTDAAGVRAGCVREQVRCGGQRAIRRRRWATAAKRTSR